VDGDMGKVHTFYFDDQNWTIRYLVVETGNWLLERQVLISPVALGYPNWEGQMLPVKLTKQQVEDSPPVSRDKPVSRQMETDLHTYYDWPAYWRPHGPATGLGAWAAAHMVAEQAQEDSADEAEQEDDPHLRSTREITGYHIEVLDGEMGHVEDFIVDDETWILRYMVVDTHNLLPGKNVLIAPLWVEQVNWAESKVHLNLERENIANSPGVDLSSPVNREYETRLYDYYGRPKYWSRLEAMPEQKE